MRKGSTSFGKCKVRFWRCLFGDKIPIFMSAGAVLREFTSTHALSAVP